MTNDERLQPEYLGDIPTDERFNIGRTSYGTLKVRTPNGMVEVKPGSRPQQQKQAEQPKDGDQS